MSYGGWILFLQSRLDGIEATQTHLSSRSFQLGGVIIVALGVILGLFDFPSFTVADIRAVASLWLLTTFTGVGVIVLGTLLRSARSRTMFERPPTRMARGGAAVATAMGGIFFSGMVMSLFLVEDWSRPAPTPSDVLRLALVILTYALGIVFVFGFLSTPLMISELNARRRRAEQLGLPPPELPSLGASARILTVVLCVFCWLGAAMSASVSFQTVALSRLGWHTSLQLVGAGYLVLVCVLMLVVIDGEQTALDKERRKTRGFLIAAIKESEPLDSIRRGYAEVVQVIADEDALRGASSP